MRNMRKEKTITQLADLSLITGAVKDAVNVDSSAT